jgi:hypothetical protein
VILAHTVGAVGGVEIELFLLGAGFLVAAFFFRPSQVGNARTAVVCLILGIALMTGSVIVPRVSQSTTTARVSIVAPTDGAEVPAKEPVPIEVQIKGGKVAASAQDPNAGHLHVFVDDQLQSMPTSIETDVTLTPGPHEIKIEFVDSQHLSYNPPVADTVKVTAR